MNTLIWDKSAPGEHGSFTFRGSGLNKKDKFTLDSHGWYTERDNVTSFDIEHITVRLDNGLNYTFDFTLNAASDVTTKSCKPH